MDFTASLFSALAADAGLTALLAEYDGDPAIFSGDAIPEDFEISEDPFVWIRPPHGGTNVDDFSSNSRTIDLDVSLFAKASESGKKLDDAAEVARLALHRQILPGAAAPFCTVTGPLSAPTSDLSIAGRRLATRLHVRG